MASITSLPSGVSGSSLVLISEQTASSSATIDFTSDIDSTYKEYVFKFIDIHPATDGAHFLVNFRDGSSAYDATKTTTAYYAYHDESDSEANVIYSTGSDLSQSTSGQRIAGSVGNDADQSTSGTLHLFDPSNTTFVKHFIANVQNALGGDSSRQDFIGNAAVITNGNYNYNWHSAGYCNVTAAIDGVQFSFSSGNIDSGTIKMYGVV
jgi:hypothetical protein